jgi:hypothetical protein
LPGPQHLNIQPPAFRLLFCNDTANYLWFLLMFLLSLLVLAST